MLDCSLYRAYLAALDPSHQSGDGQNTHQQANKVDKEHAKLTEEAATVEIENQGFQ